MGRDTTADRTPVLMNADQNIGNSTVLLPQEGIATVIPQTNPARLLNLTGGSAVGQTISIIFTASRIVGAQNPNPGLPGPVTGVLEFGSGGRSTKVEFDVPVGPFTGFFQQATNAVEPQDGGVIVTVPTSVLRAYTRYDNLLLTPVLGTSPPQSLAQVHGISPVFGPGGPMPVPLSNRVIPAEPLLVQAMSAYFTRARAKAYKTLTLYASSITTLLPTPTLVGTPGNNYDFFCLPAYARSFKILRFPSTASIDVILNDAVRGLETFTVGATPAPAPEIPLTGRETIIGLRSTTNNDTVLSLALSCEVGI
jgi:hypothetical protein